MNPANTIVHAARTNTDDRWRKKRNVKVTVNGKTSPRAIYALYPRQYFTKWHSHQTQHLLMFLYLVKGSVYVDETEHIDAQAQYIDGNHGYESFDHI